MICYKKILFFLLIFVFLFCSCSFCAETNVNPTAGGGGTLGFQNDNEYMTLMSIQEAIQSRFINQIYARQTDEQANALVQRLFVQFKSLGGDGKFLYIKENNSGASKQYEVYTSYTGSLTKKCVDSYSYHNVVFPNCPVLSGEFYLVCGINQNGCFSSTDYISTTTMTIPLACATSVYSGFVDLFHDFGLIHSSEFTTYYNLLNSIKTLLQNQSSEFMDIANSIDSNGNKIKDSIEKSTTDINNNLNNNDTSEIDTSGITNSDTTVDITQDGFNSIFTTLQTYFTSNNGGSMVLNIPFTNKSITISKATVYGNFKQLSTVENLASIVWYFVISLYIVKQVQKMINKIKSGNLEDVVDNNIKADIL